MMIISVFGTKSEIKKTFRYAHAEIRTQVVVIRGPTRYQLDLRWNTAVTDIAQPDHLRPEIPER